MRVVLKIFLALMVVTAEANAFSLLGPYTDWMNFTNGYRQPDDIGGPMDLGEEYRWNVPELTYAFDQSFLDYFGSNGVAAVEQAIQILNDLPPASEITVTNFPLDSTRYNYVAQALNLYDLKSSVLSVLLEQMGLAEPTRHVFDLRRWDPILYPSDETTWWPGVIPYYIVERNFDPENPAASHWVNDVLLTGYVGQFGSGSDLNHDVVEVPVDPLAWTRTAVADRRWSSGSFYNGLTRDDVGGLCYLLQTNNCNLEALLPGVHGVGTNAGSYVNHALRQGVNKITFVRPDYDALLGQFFTPFTNQFTDRYVTNNVLVEQELERVITQPDFLFSSGDPGQNVYGLPFVTRTSTSNWWNGASLPGMSGPGIIRPSVSIMFSRPGPTLQTYDSMPEGYLEWSLRLWGSFNASTNPPIIYPAGSSAGNDLTIRLQLLDGSKVIRTVSWQTPLAAGQLAAFQTSTNLTDWTTLLLLPNHGGVVQWLHSCSRPQRFFRAVPQ